MGLLLVRKLVRASITVLLLVTAVFLILRASGDPAVMMLGVEVSPVALENFRDRWGLNDPVWVQYAIYLKSLAQGDFGRSYIGDRSAWDVVAERLPATLILMVSATVLAVVAGVLAGVLAALNRNSWIDRLVMVIAAAGFSAPNFVLGIFLIVLFGAIWQILPTAGSDTFWHGVLPVLTLASADAAVFARFTRSAVLETLNQPLMRTALAKGVPYRAAVLRHALPNSAIGLVTVFGLFVGRLVSGAVVTENVFAWPGVGSLLVLSVENRDFAVVQTIVILIGITMVCANLLVDLSYLWLDPRTRRTRSWT